MIGSEEEPFMSRWIVVQEIKPINAHCSKLNMRGFLLTQTFFIGTTIPLDKHMTGEYDPTCFWQ